MFFEKFKEILLLILITNFVLSATADNTKYYLIKDNVVEGNIEISLIDNNEIYYRYSNYDYMQFANILENGELDTTNELNLKLYDFKIKDNYIYYTGSNQFSVANIDNFSNPVKVFGSNYLRADYVSIFGNFAYIKFGGHYLGTCGIKLFDISDSSNINEVGSWFHDNVNEYSLFLDGSMVLLGNYLYFSGAISYPGVEIGNCLVQVFDITDPANIKDIARLENPYSFTPYSSSMPKIAYANGYIYMANGNRGLDIININDPANLFFESNYPTSSSIENIYADGNHIFISYETEEKLEILDVTEPLKPVLVYKDKIYPSWHVRNNVTSNDKYVFISGYDETFSQCRFHVLEKTVVPSYNIPHIACSEQWSSYLIANNGGGEKGNVRVYLYNQDGQELSMETYEISPYQTLQIPLTEGMCGKVDIFGENITLKESFVHNLEGGIAEFALTNISNTEVNYLLPGYNGENLTWMGIALMNPGTESANVTLKAYDSLGTELGTVSGVIDPNTRTVGMLTGYFPEIDYTKVAKIKVKSDNPVTGITISGNENKQLLFTSADKSSYDTGNLNITHIATEWNDWENKLIYDNTSETETINSILNFYNINGEKISYEITLLPLETKVIDINQYSGIVPESGIIENTNEKLAIRQSFISKTQLGTAEFVLSSTSNKGLMYTFPTYYKDILTWNGISLYNPGETQSNAEFFAYSNGEMVDYYSSTIESKTRTVGVLGDYFQAVDTKLIDKVIIQSTTPLTGISISGSNWDRLLFTEALPIEVSDQVAE